MGQQETAREIWGDGSSIPSVTFPIWQQDDNHIQDGTILSLYSFPQRFPALTLGHGAICDSIPGLLRL